MSRATSAIPRAATLAAAIVLGEWLRRSGEQRFAPAIMVWFAAPLMGLACLPLIRSGNPIGLGLASACIVLLFPWPIARGVLVPLGRWRAAFAISHLAFFMWRGDPRGGALVGALMAARNAAPAQRERARAFVEGRRAHTVRLGGAGILADAMVTAARGDQLGARALMSSLRLLDARACPPLAQRLAHEWLAAESATRGDWNAVVDLATHPLQTRRSRFLALVAKRLLAVHDAPTDTMRSAARRGCGRGCGLLLGRALGAPLGTARPRPCAESPETDVHSRALSLHARCLVLSTAKILTLGEIQQLGRAWDRFFEDSARARAVETRARALGARQPQAVLQHMRVEVESDLRLMAERARLPIGDLDEGDGVLGIAARRLHDELLDTLEIDSQALDARIDAERDLPPVEEWRAFLALRQEYVDAAALGGIDLRRLAYTDLHQAVCALGARLWNVRRERAIANAMFRFLLEEAELVDDQEAIALQKRNVDCGL